jgi:hypothetical protein
VGRRHWEVVLVGVAGKICRNDFTERTERNAAAEGHHRERQSRTSDEQSRA